MSKITGRIGEKPTRVVIVSGDDEDGGVTVIDNAHSKTHKGEMYVMSHYVASLADDGLISFLVDPNEEEDLHVTWSSSCGGDQLVTVYENPIVSSNGTVLLQESVNRSMSHLESPVSAYHTPTVTNNGHQWLQYFVPGGTTGQSQGSTDVLRRETEVIFDKYKTYLITVQNIAGSAKPASLVVEYYLD